MVPDIVAQTRGPFWEYVITVAKRLVAGRSSRLDWAGAAARVLQVIVRSAHCSTGILHNPLTGEGYPSIRKIAKLAKTSLSVTKRALRALRHEGFIIYVKHDRDQDEAGKWFSRAPSMRRFSWDRFFAGMDRTLRGLFEGWRAKRAAKEAKLEAERIEKEAQMRKAHLEAARNLAAAKRRPLPPQQAMPGHDRETRMALMDAIHAEHPEWGGEQIAQELRRRAAAPPTRGPSEPQTSDGPARKS